MSEVTVRALSADDWEEYRAIRLEALRDAPDAFSSSLDEEAAYDEAFWRLRMDRSARLLAEARRRTGRRRVGRHRRRARGVGACSACGCPRSAAAPASPGG
ncbi:hypothetical protein GCM10025868_30550 [Angustibacter aerolatus]|uniref:N-acetyltransferase domain-containing protein n=1 Tax=Angustibacter aerolatus TaxID=1162965 RepID=A0ABQ6JM03_9ACTN|nr:hypothetical protein GCM10025868_30550 [Angustibacter aerolatus]